MDQLTDAVPRPALQYDGRIGELYRIFLVNMLLTIVTLGIYRFWAITRWRRYFWSHLRFQGERLEYTGRGGELFLGFLMAIGILIGLGLIAVLLAVALRFVYPPLAIVPMIALYMFIYILAFAARFSALRYRLSRTLWCGIRGGMQGSALAYGLHAVLYSLLLLPTLLQMTPWMQLRLAERRINAARLGSAAFSFRGRARSIYPAYLATEIAVLVLLAIIAGLIWSATGSQLLLTLSTAPLSDPRIAFALERALPFIFIGVFLFGIGAALISSWYSALFVRHVFGHTRLDALAFGSTMSGGRLFSLIVGNGLIVLLTLGLGLPIAMHRVAHLLARTIQVAGVLDVAALHQSSLAMPRTGEGMLQVLDHGAIF